MKFTLDIPQSVRETIKRAETNSDPFLTSLRFDEVPVRSGPHQVKDLIRLSYFPSSGKLVAEYPGFFAHVLPYEKDATSTYVFEM